MNKALTSPPAPNTASTEYITPGTTLRSVQRQFHTAVSGAPFECVVCIHGIRITITASREPIRIYVIALHERAFY